MKSRIKTMWELAIKEAKKLKKFATQEEKDSLDIETFNGESKMRCIYGQMTGHCESIRANELILKSCEKVYSTKKVRNLANGKLNGKPNKVDTTLRTQIYVSPIEMLIFDNHAGIEAAKKLIPFIKGEIKTIKAQ